MKAFLSAVAMTLAASTAASATVYSGTFENDASVEWFHYVANGADQTLDNLNLGGAYTALSLWSGGASQAGAFSYYGVFGSGLVDLSFVLAGDEVFAALSFGSNVMNDPGSFDPLNPTATAFFYDGQPTWSASGGCSQGFFCAGSEDRTGDYAFLTGEGFDGGAIIEASAVSEPGTMSMMGAALLGLGLYFRRRSTPSALRVVA